MITGIGIACIVIAVLGLIMKLWVSYETEGGAIGMTPALDGVISCPSFAILGLYFLTKWNVLTLFMIWLAFTLLMYAAIGFAGKLGEKSHSQS